MLYEVITMQSDWLWKGSLTLLWNESLMKGSYNREEAHELINLAVDDYREYIEKMMFE